MRLRTGSEHLVYSQTTINDLVFCALVVHSVAVVSAFRDIQVKGE